MAKTATELHIEVLKTLKCGNVTVAKNPDPQWPGVHSTIDGAMEAAIAALQRLPELEEQLERAKFEPLGDNHHNANKCPYCREQAGPDHSAMLSDVAHQLQRWANEAAAGNYVALVTAGVTEVRALARKLFEAGAKPND